MGIELYICPEFSGGDGYAKRFYLTKLALAK